MKHKHKVEHRPISGTGYEVCTCGATRRVENGEPVIPKWHNRPKDLDSKGWHTCKLCVTEDILEGVNEDK